MRSLDELGADRARRIDTVVFDLDDTLLDHGRLHEHAYRSLFRLEESGLELVVCTGRSVAWAEVVARQWPVAAAIAENGALAWVRRGERVELSDPVSESERARRHDALRKLADDLCAAHPELGMADDNVGRRSDVTLDIGEHRQVPAEIVHSARQRASREDVRTFASSIHLHLSFDAHDKASGFAALSVRRGRDPAIALARAAFVGDSTNDASAFAAFGLTFAVQNVRPYLGAMTLRPAYVAAARMGAGFAQIAAAITRLRADV